MDANEDKTFYTVTMARVYADQGRYAQAARIYRYLLDQTPDRADLRQALEAVVRHLPDASPQWHAVSDTVRRWARMVLRQKVLRDHRRAAVRFDGLEKSSTSDGFVK